VSCLPGLTQVTAIEAFAKRLPTEAGADVWKVALPADGSRAAARAALGELLGAYLGTDAPPELSADANGKPRLAEDPGRLAFNLSHSGTLALVAIAPGDAEVGVDVELIRPRRDLVRLATRWLPEADADAVAAASGDGRDAAFYAAWTRHEARVKCTGAGLSGPPPGPEVEAFQLEVGDGYAAAVALRGGRGRG